MSARGRAVRPPWLRVRPVAGPRAAAVEAVLGRHGLLSVCREARCPNAGECWGVGTATFLMLGESCTRSCRFCGVGKGRPRPVDPGEPLRTAKAVRELGLSHVVVTSVTRDDLPDGGASSFVETLARVREVCPGVSVELLVPDFGGNWAALESLVAARPDVLAHNVETVPRLYPAVRPGAVYRRSVELLSRARALSPRMKLKSGMMLGVGERVEEVCEVLRDLSGAGCSGVTMGQYLSPSPAHLPVVEYISPDVFSALGERARTLGFSSVLSAPLVRSSYRAGSEPG